jgi:hypothetical protein
MPNVRAVNVTTRRAIVRPALYLVIIVLSVLGALVYKLHTESIFACPASGYGSGQYLAYCQTNGYGDYDHGAFWFGLEPDAQRAATNAEVLFIGNSRMQFGFSTDATTRFFAASATPFYMLGFSYGENVLFEAPLLANLKPQASVYVINVDRFFDQDFVTQPTEALRHVSGDLQSRYEEKKRWQIFHKGICGSIPALCGHQVAFFRTRDTGVWQLQGSENFKTSAIADAAPEAGDLENIKRDAALADKFLSSLPVKRNCIILTLAPWGDTSTAQAHAMADALKLTLVTPKLTDLRTFDGDHLDHNSAERWSGAFFEAAGPQIRQCLNDVHSTGK